LKGEALAVRTNCISLGDRGESLVASELQRRGFQVRRLGPRAHDWDLIAEKHGYKRNVQVKTIGSGSWQCGNATKYIKIDLINEIQSVRAKQPLADPDGIYVFVNLQGARTFYLTTARDIQDLVYSEYRTNLKKHHGRRPRNPYSFHHASGMDKLSRWKDNWRILSK
jgi:hypothetical protein